MPEPHATPRVSGDGRTTVRRGRPTILTGAAVLFVGAVAGWGGTLFPEGSPPGWICDLTTHFRVYGLAAAVLWLPLTLRIRGAAASALCGAAICVNAAILLPAWLPGWISGPAGEDAWPADGADEAQIGVIGLNVQYTNGDTRRVIDYLRTARADIVVLVEVNAAWAAAVAELAAEYPASRLEPRATFEGLAVLSRWPIRTSEVIDFGTLGIPSIVATVATPGGDLEVIATHPRPQLTPALDRELRGHLRRVGERAAASRLPCLVVGDLNATPWSAPFRGLLAAGGLENTSRGRGVQPTWNARFIAPRIPIDHILASPGMRVVERRVGPDVGSDHFPVEIRLRLPNRVNAAGGQRDGARAARSMPSRLIFL